MDIPTRLYDALGRILSEGGELTVGYGLHQGWSQERINAILERRFGAMDDETRDLVYQFGRGTLAGGRGLNALALDTPIDMGTIIVNPWVFGSDPAGRRLKLITNATGENGAFSIDVWHDVPDMLTTRMIVGDTMQYAVKTWQLYPGRFNVTEPIQPDQINVTFIMAERRF